MRPERVRVVIIWLLAKTEIGSFFNIDSSTYYYEHYPTELQLEEGSEE